MIDNVNNIEVYLHIGLHKTATTYLQANIFPEIAGVTFYNKSFAPEKIYEGKSKIILSNEGMSGCPYLIDKEDYFKQFKDSVNYLLGLFKNPKFIVCFREPGSFIGSCYKQYLHEGGILKWEEFFSIEGESKLDPDTFLLSKYVNFLSDRVPVEQFFIYDFESFKRFPEIVIDEMTKYIVDRSYSYDIKRSKKSNSAVPLSLETLLITCNKLFGNKMSVKIFGKVFSQRTILQTYIPRLIKFDKKRDLSKIRSYFETDYALTRKLISDLNPTLYNRLAIQT